MTIMGTKMTFGVKEEWATARILNLPIGAKVIRRRFRPCCVGVAFLKFGSNEMRQYYLAIEPHGLKLHGLCGINRKEPQ